MYLNVTTCVYTTATPPIPSMVSAAVTVIVAVVVAVQHLASFCVRS